MTHEAPVPAAGTVERWAWDYVTSEDLDHKLHPPEVPRTWEPLGAPTRRIERPGRPAGLERLAKAPKSPGTGALRDRSRRARLAHTFLHHEVQAAELFAWALLAFPDAPPRFRRGICTVLCDELRHARALSAWLGALGHRYGDFAVRDWFWERVPASRTPAELLAALCIGLEGANLDHTARFAPRLYAAGDPEGAALVERIGDEEVAHVRFALRWWCMLTGERELAFDTWCAHLPPPLTPSVLAARPVHRAARLAAGHSERFVDALERWLIDHPPAAGRPARCESPGS